jgi:hypothetical protein
MEKIDLTKPFLTNEDILVEVSDNGKDWDERHILSHDGDVYRAWDKGLTGKKAKYNINCTSSWFYARHIPEKRYMTRDEIIEWIAKEQPKILVKVKTEESWELATRWSYNASIEEYHYKDLETGEIKEFTV